MVWWFGGGGTVEVVYVCEAASIRSLSRAGVGQAYSVAARSSPGRAAMMRLARSTTDESRNRRKRYRINSDKIKRRRELQMRRDLPYSC